MDEWWTLICCEVLDFFLWCFAMVLIVSSCKHCLNRYQSWTQLTHSHSRSSWSNWMTWCFWMVGCNNTCRKIHKNMSADAFRQMYCAVQVYLSLSRSSEANTKLFRTDQYHETYNRSLNYVRSMKFSQLATKCGHLCHLDQGMVLCGEPNANI